MDKKQMTTDLFWKVISIYTVFLAVVLGVIWQRIDDIEAKTVETQIASARIETQLSQIQKDLTELKVLLQNHTN